MKKEILLGITGGIAAYKVVEVASRLTKMGYSVNTVMTEGGTKFVAPLTFQSITHNPVHTDLFSPPEHFNVKHISLADRADLCLIAPATANFIGKLAGGIADNLLSTIIMATKAPILIAPSMNVNMYHNSIFQDNISYLKKKGYEVIDPDKGYLACGYQGEGRLPEPELLVDLITGRLSEKDFAGKKILVTAGPTREYLDPIRFLSNKSSGKMGYALARTAARRGAEVTLLSGPVNLTPPYGVETIFIESASQLAEEVKLHSQNYDIVIMAAAVADFRPADYQKEKIKKGKQFDNFKLNMMRNSDILEGIGRHKKKRQILVGFAAESEDLLNNARDKMEKKNLDMIVANDIAGFTSDQNSVTIITNKYAKDIPLMKKTEIAGIIFDRISELLK
ncbi:bifunctional phosphopantothenoylcysteine decarboxylase/phosphopantothenate--cysteine ligase CoaBC [Halocella sp. SP3-1]|uniref:bifunctional phosphopantothenoylcysteine decarboxylase/phosphopantothenate--cysteine ligase CoaBC n=1 Tax=Halocella sp. SP3-1 TaxID=2382161 RepID=UPI000F75B7D7|nr:bifunctional phosphopantothenoylcysteine decarboxylase/phosphopantothenate--cysteine ligase CoaBC [Halocella sp. SP3-1]AZO95207.1 bifunctional phosphopantothenoylcysteine decarboxylase/phosphopantothenate--cysteine ligase CoaBC [Halocella sp. SP3-1]